MRRALETEQEASCPASPQRVVFWSFSNRTTHADYVTARPAAGWCQAIRPIRLACLFSEGSEVTVELHTEGSLTIPYPDQAAWSEFEGYTYGNG